MDVIWDDLAELMNEYCKFYGQTATDKYGKLTYTATANSVRGKLVWDTLFRRETDEKRVNPSGKFITYGIPSTAIGIMDKMQLPNGTFVTITNVAIVSDENGPHHNVVMFG